MINKKFVSPALMWLIIFSGVALILWLVPAEAVLAQNAFIYILVVSAVFYWLYFFSFPLIIKACFQSSSFIETSFTVSTILGL